MDSLFLLQFACFIFMFINAFIVALSCLHVRWKNKRYERSRWMIVAAIIGLAIQYVIQMKFGFRAIDDDLGAVINILIYTPCFSLICMGIYNLETTRANRRKMYLVCGAIYAAIILIFCVGVSLHQSLYIREGLYLMLVLFCMSVSYCIYMIIREMNRRRKMLETMAATDMLPYVRYSRASIFILCLPVLILPVAMFTTTLLYILAPVGLMALLFFNLTFIALGSNLHEPLGTRSFMPGTTRSIQQYRHHPKPLSGTRCRQCAGRESGFPRQSLQGFEMERKRTGILYPLPQRNGSGIQPNLRLRKPRKGVERFCQEDARLAASYPGKNAFRQDRPERRQTGIGTPYKI